MNDTRAAFNQCRPGRLGPPVYEGARDQRRPPPPPPGRPAGRPPRIVRGAAVTDARPRAEAPRLPPGTACTPVTVAPSNVDACIYCAQGTPLPLPSEGAHYVWTDSWFTSLACEWRCDPGRDTDETDGTCPAHVYPPFLWFLPAVAALGMGVLMVGLLFFCARHTAAVAPIGMMTEEEEGMPDNGTLIRRSEGVIRLKMP